MAHFAVIAIGADRPGIVAALTGALYESAGNLEDVSSSILRGNFAIMLVVDAPVPAAELERDLERAAKPLGVSVTVRDVEAGAPLKVPATHTLVAYAADRPGIVAGLTRLLADRGVNVTDLSCRISGEAGGPIYVMVAEVAVPPNVEVEALAREIAARASELGVDVSFRPIEADTL
jgi:glycine cleavage system transcriptional repressor